MSEQLKAALIRALVGALIASSLVFFTALADETNGWREIVSVTGAAFFGYAGFRTLFEGGYDTWRASRNDVQPADVGARVSHASHFTPAELREIAGPPSGIGMH